MTTTFKRIAALALCGAILSLAAPAVAAPNLITSNPGWDDGDPNPKPPGADLDQLLGPSGPGKSFGRDATGDFFAFNVNGGTIDLAELVQRNTNLMVKTYSIAVDLYRTGSFGSTSSWILKVGSTVVGSGLLNDLPTGSWKTVFAVFNQPSAGSFDVSFGVKDMSGNGSVYFDNHVLVEGDITPVPGPEIGAAAIPMVAGLAGFLAWRRRRQAVA